MVLCDYNCGNEAKYQFKNGKFCCSYFTSKCPQMKEINRDRNLGHKVNEETRKKLSELNKGKKFTDSHKKNLSNSHKGKPLSLEHRKKISESNRGKKFSNSTRKKLSKALLGHPGYFKGKKLSLNHRKKISESNLGKKQTKEAKKKISKSLKYSIEKIIEKYPLFSQIEKMRYNPDKAKEKEIQVHCKNHNCKNSKEKGSWFTPSSAQIYERIRGFDNNLNYFYCSDKCKNICPVYNLKSDPYRKTEKLYSQEEYITFRNFVLERDNYTCQFCGEEATEVHHERPQKLEPFFSLDPDFAWSCCEKCHYEKGHKDECNTGNLANRVC